jgi:coenzyme PQQ synthesis protein D (PqqD)
MSETLRLRADALEWRDVEGEVVAVDLRTSTYLAVNASGAKLWPALASGATRDQLTDVLVDQFQLPRDQARSDVEAFVRMLEHENLLLEE